MRYKEDYNLFYKFLHDHGFIIDDNDMIWSFIYKDIIISAKVSHDKDKVYLDIRKNDEEWIKIENILLFMENKLQEYCVEDLVKYLYKSWDEILRIFESGSKYKEFLSYNDRINEGILKEIFPRK